MYILIMTIKLFNTKNSRQCPDDPANLNELKSTTPASGKRCRIARREMRIGVGRGPATYTKRLLIGIIEGAGSFID